MKNLFLIMSVFSSSFVFASDEASSNVNFEIPKMKCGGCVKRVTKTLTESVGVSNVEVSLEKHQANFTCAKGSDLAKSCDLESIKAKLDKMGYPAKEI